MADVYTENMSEIMAGPDERKEDLNLLNALLYSLDTDVTVRYSPNSMTTWSAYLLGKMCLADTMTGMVSMIYERYPECIDDNSYQELLNIAYDIDG